MECTVFPLHLRHPFPNPSSLLLRLTTPRFHFQSRSIFVSNNRFLLRLCPRLLCRSRRWDSNYPKHSSFNHNDEGEEPEDDNAEGWGEVFQDYVDSIWIFKVFHSYGWMLPPIILSLLFATGLKAFLMALTLAVSMSTLAFASQKMLKVRKYNQNPNADTMMGRSPTQAPTKVEQEVRKWARNPATKKKKANQTWASKNDISVSNYENTVSNFGGWDELDERRPSKIAGSPAQKSSQQTGPAENNKLDWRSDESLLLRLLIAVFPFLDFTD